MVREKLRGGWIGILILSVINFENDRKELKEEVNV